ncbi:hypothetical protein AYK26_07815 [Euryarchaeota archaeon SM23-78]|nr:MAG: hypothetical protein AYK26_07815 [Euryarchaeota archaeon SM23-78]MBW3001375.1 hypothetical protein [Candidatus Woesearchaeota archaeon]
MILKKRAHSGSGIELIIIGSVIFLIVISIIIIVQKETGESKRQELYQEAGKVGNIISTEVENAKSSPGTYSRKFFVPETINGREYVLYHKKTEVIITVSGVEYVLFIDPNVNGVLKKGWNTIEKTGNATSYSININI